MKNKTNSMDKITIKQEKGTWKRFIKVIGKSHLPIPFIIIYIIMNITLVNVGISETDYTAKLFAGDVSVELVLKLVAVLVINLVCANITTFMRMVTEARINRNARLSVWNKFLKVPMGFFKDSDPQDAIYRVVNNASAVGTTIILVFIPLFTSAYGIVACLMKLFTYDYRLSIIIVAFFPVSVLLAFLTGRLKRTTSMIGTNIIALLTDKLSEVVKNIPLAKAFAKEKDEEKKGEDICKRLYSINIKSGWIDKLSELAFSFSDLIQTALIVLMGVFLLKRGDINNRAWIAFFMFSGSVMGYVSNLIMYWHNSKNIQGIVDKVSHIMDCEKEQSGDKDAGELSGDIELKDIKFSYDDSRDVLTGLNCTFKEHKTTALLGISGCGKSTVVNLIDRIYIPDEGTITVGGVDIKDYELDSYRKRFAVVPQNVMLFSGSIRENICFGLNDITDEQINDVLKRVSLYDFVYNLPDGLDSDIGERGDQLSGGQKQKIAIARMILSKAEYLILDEATASIDSVAVNEIKSILKDVLKDKTVILIAHTSNMMSLVDNAIIIENGKMAAQGNIREVISANEFCASLVKGAETNE